jgi:hypothetical protein
MLPVLVAGFWMFPQQKGCDWLPAAPPVHASTESSAREGTPQPVILAEERLTRVRTSRGASPDSDPRNRSIQRAGVLLKQASGLLEKNERLALRLIQEAIAILRHEVIRGTDEPGYDRTYAPLSPFGNDAAQGKIVRSKDPP